jgi:molybdenum cofactor cytidylyltransferase
VADFFCAEKKLVIELDGKVHDFQKDYDANRDSILNQLGLQVLRIKNEELSNVYSVLKRITSLTHPPSPSLQSREGVVEQSETGGESAKVALLILAAGSSSRMKTSKQLLLINGQTLLRKTVQTAIDSALGNVVVVLGSNAASHQQVLSGLPAAIVINNQWTNGIGSSLKVGATYIESNYPRAKGIIVMVCDQPFLTTDHLIKLEEASRLTGKPIVASSYAGTIGVPCFFDSTFISTISTISDEEGAKKLLKLHSENVTSIEFLNGDVDLDTPEDLRKIDSEN